MKQFFIKNNINGSQKVNIPLALPTVLWAACPNNPTGNSLNSFRKIPSSQNCRELISLISRLFLIPLIFLLLFSACAPPKSSPPPLPQTSPPLASDTLHHPRKIAPYRYGEDPSIMKAKRKYIPREIWDVAGSPDLAKERIHLNEAVKKDPSNYEPLYFLGFNYLEARMLNESAETFEKVLKLKPDHPLALENLALAYFQNHLYDKALAVSKRGLKLYPGNPRLIYLQGQCYLSGENNPEKAEKIYTEAVSKGIKSPHIYTGLAEVYMEHGEDQKDQAYRILDKCIDEFPGYPNASALLAELCMERGDAEKAVSLLRQVIEITPAFTDARRLLGEIYIETAHYKSAEETLTAALNQRPDNINEIKNRLGEVYVNTEQTEKAREILRQVINFRGEDPDRSENLAQAYLMLAMADLTEGKTSSARQNIGNAEKEKYDPATLTLLQSRLLTQQGEYDKAASLLQNFSQQTDEENSLPPYKIYLEMAKIEAHRGNKPKAAVFLKTAFEKAAGYQKTTLKTLISYNDKLKSIKALSD